MKKIDNNLLDSVKNPARYFGGEYGTPNMDKPCDVRFCLCVPDSYEVGMSNLGTKILYHLFNEQDGVVCERCYAPWLDYAEYLKSNNQTLHSLETQKPLKEFDFVGFSFQFELGYTNLFYMLELSGIPFLSSERGDDFPFIVAGGPCCVNPEPIYKFIDIIFVGEGEEIWPKILYDYKNFKNRKKDEFLEYLHQTYDCIYVPKFYENERKNGKLVGFGNKKIIKKYKIKDLDKSFYPVNQIVPNIEIVHDRAVAELFRGCYNGCRFCQAGYIYRPVRQRKVDTVLNISKGLCDIGGFDELSLNSLSSGDYEGLPELMEKLKPYTEKNRVQVSLPSLRLDSFDGAFADQNRRSSLTFAPEAGTQRLRDVINKNITEDDIFGSVNQAFDRAFSTVKFYFMIGLPTETMEDVQGIVDLVYRIKQMYYSKPRSAKGLRISVSVSTFIPKPFTPFQWEAFDTRENIAEKQKYLYDKLNVKNISVSWHDYDNSLTEAVLARGGRELADCLLYAYKLGARFDAWSEYFKYDNYKQAFEHCGVDINSIVGKKDENDILPWDFISVGVNKEFLIREKKLAYQAVTTPSCNKQCNGCGLKKEGFCK